MFASRGPEGASSSGAFTTASDLAPPPPPAGAAPRPSASTGRPPPSPGHPPQAGPSASGPAAAAAGAYARGGPPPRALDPSSHLKYAGLEHLQGGAGGPGQIGLQQQNTNPSPHMYSQHPQSQLPSAPSRLLPVHSSNSHHVAQTYARGATTSGVPLDANGNPVRRTGPDGRQGWQAPGGGAPGLGAIYESDPRPPQTLPAQPPAEDRQLFQ